MSVKTTINEAEAARRRRAVDKARRSSETEGSRSSEERRAALAAPSTFVTGTDEQHSAPQAAEVQR